MASCRETHGEGWSGESPNCVYSPSSIGGPVGDPFDVSEWGKKNWGDRFFSPTPDESGGFRGTPESLGYGEILEGSSLEDDWQEYFDSYDTKREDMAVRTAGINIGQLESAWDLTGTQLGQSWGLKIGELGAGAGAGYRKVGEFGSGAKRKFGGAFSGSIADITRRQREDVSGAYKRAFGLGQTAYDQAMATGEMGLQQKTMDIYQDLETDVYDLRADWEKDQRDTLNVLLGQDIWPEDVEGEGRTTPTPPPPTKGDCYAGCDEKYPKKLQAGWRATCRLACEAWG